MQEDDCECGNNNDEEIQVYEKFEKSMGGTVRACIDCGTLVFGGPTRCAICANKTIEKLEKRLSDVEFKLENLKSSSQSIINYSNLWSS